MSSLVLAEDAAVDDEDEAEAPRPVGDVPEVGEVVVLVAEENDSLRVSAIRDFFVFAPFFFFFFTLVPHVVLAAAVAARAEEAW